MAKQSNLLICRNRVEIEGVNVGQFESFTLKSDYKALGTTAILTLPLYGIGLVAGNTNTTSQGKAINRVRQELPDVKIAVSSEVRVICWYDGYDEVEVFKGFIERIEEGFPTKFFLRDSSFMLYFGTVEKGWDGDVTLQDIANDCIKIANDGFKKEREDKGLTRSVPELKYSLRDTNVQAETTPIPFNNFAIGRSPFEVIQHLARTLCLYAGVGNDTNLFIGTGVTDSSRPIVELDTRLNVIERNIVPVDARFVNYEVKVTGLLTDGKRHTATAGLKGGEGVRKIGLLNTKGSLQAMADRLLSKLKSDRNKGTITLLLYPKCQLFDHVNFNDTIFEINNAQYYVTGYTFTASIKGFFQTLDVTDQIYLL